MTSILYAQLRPDLKAAVVEVAIEYQVTIAKLTERAIEFYFSEKLGREIPPKLSALP